LKRLRLHHHWTPWWFAAIFGVPFIPLAYAVGLAVIDPARGGEGIRIFLPLFAIFAYWILAIVFNFRTAVVDPKGIRVTLFPFPTGNGDSIKRPDIALCYTRHIIEYEDGVEIENFYTAGVETRDGRQIDIYAQLEAEGDASKAAYEIGDVLNAHPAECPIPVHTVLRTAVDSKFARLALIWCGLMFLAIFLGIFWESKSGTH
jgi:hypothetical protein